MARGTRLLNIIVDTSLRDKPEIRALAEKGHTVEVQALSRADIVLGPTCWRMEPQLLKYLDLAVKEARKERYDQAKPGKGNDATFH